MEADSAPPAGGSGDRVPAGVPAPVAAALGPTLTARLVVARDRGASCDRCGAAAVAAAAVRQAAGAAGLRLVCAGCARGVRQADAFATFPLPPVPLPAAASIQDACVTLQRALAAALPATAFTVSPSDVRRHGRPPADRAVVVSWAGSPLPSAVARVACAVTGSPDPVAVGARLLAVHAGAWLVLLRRTPCAAEAALGALRWRAASGGPLRPKLQTDRDWLAGRLLDGELLDPDPAEARLVATVLAVAGARATEPWAQRVAEVAHVAGFGADLLVLLAPPDRTAGG